MLLREILPPQMSKKEQDKSIDAGNLHCFFAKWYGSSITNNVFTVSSSLIDWRAFYYKGLAMTLREELPLEDS